MHSVQIKVVVYIIAMLLFGLFDNNFPTIFWKTIISSHFCFFLHSGRIFFVRTKIWKSWWKKTYLKKLSRSRSVICIIEWSPFLLQWFLEAILANWISSGSWEKTSRDHNRSSILPSYLIFYSQNLYSFTQRFYLRRRK